MRPVSETFLAAARQSHTPAVRVSVLDALLNPVFGGVLTGESGAILSGAVTMNRRRDVRRSIQVELANPTGDLTPARAGALLYWNQLLRAERGIVLTGGQVEYATLGTFIIDSPSAEMDADGSTVSVSGSDQMDRLLRSKFTAVTTYAAAATLRSVISDLATDAGANANHLSLDDGGQTLAAARTFEVGELRIAAIRDLATAYSLEVFADPNGMIVLRPVSDPNSLPTAWTFTAGEDAIMLGVSKRWSKARLYNHILVTGERADGTPIYAEQSDTNEGSLTYVNGPLGDRLYTYTSAMITTGAQAQAVADALFYEHVLVEEEITLPHVPNPALEVGDAIAIVEPLTDTVDRYIIDELSMPLVGGEAHLVTRKLRSLL